MTSRMKKAGITTVAGLGLFVGAAGLAAAATDGSTDTPPAVTPTAEDDDGGINCENGIDTATGAECDGGPAVAEADEANEAPDGNEAESNEAESNEAESNEAESNEAEGDEADDGVEHEFEGDEVGENGDGIPDADEANEIENETD